MDANNRRRTVASLSQSQQPPSSIPRPRQSLAPNSTAGFAPRQSLAPSRSLSNLNARQSLAPYAPAALQQSGPSSQESQLFSQGHGGPREAPATGGRNNMYSSLASASVGRSGVLRSTHTEYAPPSERRSSTFRRSTNGAMTPNHAPIPQTVARPRVDPRIPDVKTRPRYAADIVAFLTSHQYNGAVDIKMLLTPTTAQFISIFKFLVCQVDPGYEFRGRNIADEVPPALKMAGYPFPESITKSHLQSIGSSNGWPNMLAMLHWFVIVIDSRENAFFECQDLHIPAQFEDESQHVDLMSHAWLDFVGECYPQFLATDEFSADATKELEIFYQRVDGSRRELRNRVEDFELEREALEREWAEEEATEDPLLVLQAKLEPMERDKLKFVKYLSDLASKLAKHSAQGKQALADKETAHRRRDLNEELLKETSEAVKAQGFTPVEIQEMTTERAKLTANQTLANKKQQALLEKTLSLEIQLQKRIDKAQALTGTYDTKAQSLGVLPRPPDGYEHVNFAQEVQGAAENPVPDCLTFVKPALTELKAKDKAAWGVTEGEDVVLEERITRLNEALSELKEVCQTDEGELEAIESGNREFREGANGEFLANNVELERLQNQVNQLSSVMGQTLYAAESRYEQRLLERTTIVEQTNDLLKVNREALEVELDAIITYRQHMIVQTDLLYGLADEVDE